jgi:hypothetical protein
VPEFLTYEGSARTRTAVVWALPLPPPNGGRSVGSTQVLLLNLVKRENFELAGISSVRSACATGTQTSVLNLGSPEVQRTERKQRTCGPRIGITRCRGLTKERCHYWGFSPEPNGPENGFYGGRWRRERNWVPTFST